MVKSVPVRNLMQDTYQTSNDILSPRAKWVILIGLTVVALLMSFLAAELLVRIRQAAKYGSHTAHEERHTVDPKSGLPIPRADFSSGPFAINHLGFRGPNIPVRKPPEVVRIAFLGASTTICEEVSNNDLIWPHLTTTSLLQIFPKARFDYVNGGFSGYGLKSSLKNLENRLAPLKPDIIIIYHATNDMSGELRELAVKQGLISEDELKEFSWMGRYSLLWNLVEKNLRLMAAERAARKNHGRLNFDPHMLGRQFHDDYVKLIRASQQTAKLVAVATFSTHLRKGQNYEEQNRAMASALFYMPFMTFEGLLTSYEQYNRIIRDVAAETGALLIEGENEIPGTPAYFHDSVHFTEAGNKTMADRISRALAASRDLNKIVRHAYQTQ